MSGNRQAAAARTGGASGGRGLCRTPPPPSRATHSFMSSPIPNLFWLGSSSSFPRLSAALATALLLVTTPIQPRPPCALTRPRAGGGGGGEAGGGRGGGDWRPGERRGGRRRRRRRGRDAGHGGGDVQRRRRRRGARPPLARATGQVPALARAFPFPPRPPNSALSTLGGCRELGPRPGPTSRASALPRAATGGLHWGRVRARADGCPGSWPSADSRRSGPLSRPPPAA